MTPLCSRSKESPTPKHTLDPRIDPALIDSSLRDEVVLLARLIVAANASDGPLDPAVVDAALFGEN